MKWIAPHGATSASERYVNAQPTVAGSNPDAKFFNNVLDELLAVITAANLTPSDTNLHQLLDAITYFAERAAASGVIKGSFWFGKTTANFSVPLPTIIGQTYIDFTTLQTYISNDGATWTESGTFVPPGGIDFTILITSKFWDIAEQTDQQGGDAVYSHSTETWTYWPKIINLDNVVHNTGNETIYGQKTFANVLYLGAEGGVEGGEVVFESGDTEVNAGKEMFIDRYNGMFRFVGRDSQGTIRQPLEVDIQNNRCEASPSDAINSVLTTLINSKTDNGYFKLGNGLIIQWGVIGPKAAASYNGVYNFNTPFSNRPLAVFVNYTAGGNGYLPRIMLGPNSTTTTFEIGIDVFSSAWNPQTYATWLAIGY